MTFKKLVIPIGLPALVIVVLVLLVQFAPWKAPATAAGSDIWTCSMHPQIRLPQPGDCPICGMALIPVSQLPRARDDLETRAGLVTEPIERRELFKEIRTVGKLDYSERQVAFISSRIDGRVDRLFVDFTGVEVKKGDHLVEIYSPDLLVAQSELLLGLEAFEKEKPSTSAIKSFTQSRLESARTKLRLLGILDDQIREIEASRKPTTHLTIYAPMGGTVIEKNVRVGQYLKTGDPVYRIANLDPIWLYLNIYEYDVGWIRFGQKVNVQLEAFPGENFAGSIMFIDPFLDDPTRTIRIRVNIQNPNRLLKPQMFASATIHVRLRPDGTPEPTGMEGMFVCPMHPEIIQPKPGQCPICEMSLEKVPQPKAKLEIHRSPEKSAKAERQSEDHSTHAKQPTPAAPAPQSAAQSTPHDEHAGHEEHASHEGHQAKPASGKKTASAKGVLAIPVSAVLDTGRRRITYRLTGEGAYELIELKLGPRAHSINESGKEREYYVVLEGVQEGDQVVSQSGFLLDSQRQIEGMPSLLYPKGQAGTALHSGNDDHGGKMPSKPKPATGGHQH